MARTKKASGANRPLVTRLPAAAHTPTGVTAFDGITMGGLPKGRTTAVLGAAGSGKTIFALQALIKGALEFGEPGLFVAFEESAGDLAANAGRFDWGAGQAPSGVEFLDARLSESIIQGGDFDVVGLLGILTSKVKASRAQRIVFDGVDVLLGHLGDPALARREMFRIREWLDRSALTGILTGKIYGSHNPALGDTDFLRFMADCVVSLHHKVEGGTAARFLRVEKHRGGPHSANEFPFTITGAGIEITANTSDGVDYPVSSERVSSGLPRLDTMLGGGYYRGTSVLISGAPGTSKTSLGSLFAENSSQRGERTLFASFDEAPEQIIRNAASVGIKLAPLVAAGTLRLCALRTRAVDPESHVAWIRALMLEHRARNLVIDPISALTQVSGNDAGERAALQLIHLAKSAGVTVVSTSLLSNALPLSEETPLGISSIADTWMHVSYLNQGGERNRALTIIKSRGTGHSNQVRELVLSDQGLTLADVYSAGGEVLMGTLRWQRERDEARNRRSQARDGELRQREAELLLAEARARRQVIFQEETTRLAALENIKAERTSDGEQALIEMKELSTRRRADLQLAILGKRRR